MKKTVKRYKVFLLLALANIIIGLVVPEIGERSLDLTRVNLMEMLSVLPPIFVLLGLLDVWVDRATMIRYTGKGSGFKGVLISFLLGSAAAGPLYAAFPVAGVMMKKGSSLTNIFIFIGAWSTTKIPMLTFEAASLGLPFTLTRLALSIVGITTIALITQKSLNDQQKEQLYKLHQTQ
ncbi:MAG: permease [Eubacteriales bacterium]|jgi:uncharacterized membrane protein YraQ (UPF0718 family)|nr:permease [Eubacteriales bacterium]MDD4105178.1 permease [Eubacteriales bacterium]MDD4710775.1 permease [Eubacteriales bacterium]NLO16099.1 permease [Clostridiales bacterium]